MAKIRKSQFNLGSRANVCGYRLGRVKGTIEHIKTGVVYATMPDDVLGQKAWRFLIEGRC